MAFLAPAGTPVTLRDMAHGLVRAARAPKPVDELSTALHVISGLSRGWPVSSGRAAMTVILRAMRAAAGNPDQTEVIVPAYTCYSVPAAIERAGLRVRLCDVNPVTLGMDTDRLRRCDFTRVLAVVSANLYGLPNNLVELESICRERGVYFLDDAAQALGASISNRPVGSFGDAGLYSFDKGKIISTIQGGAIVCGPGGLAEQLTSAVAELPELECAERAGNFIKLWVYSVFLRPTLYPLIRALPFTGLGHTAYEPRYPIARLSAFSSAVAARLLGRLDELGSTRRRNAAALHRALDGLPAIETVQPLPGVIAAYARFPVLVRNRAMRAGLIAAFERAGIGATASYPLALADVPEVRERLPQADTDCPGARRIASTILTLPTHAYCPADLPDRVRKVIEECTI